MDFLLWLKALQADGRLLRIIIDEVHTVLLDYDWHKAVDLILQLSCVPCTPIITLTTTLAPFSERAFFEKLCILCNTTVIQASSTVRANIWYSIIMVEGNANNTADQIVSNIQTKHLLQDKECGIIF